jgi:hypothetical protein
MRSETRIRDQCGKRVRVFPMMKPDENIAGEKVGKRFENPSMDFCSRECMAAFIREIMRPLHLS